MLRGEAPVVSPWPWAEHTASELPGVTAALGGSGSFHPQFWERKKENRAELGGTPGLNSDKRVPFWAASGVDGCFLQSH